MSIATVREQTLIFFDTSFTTHPPPSGCHQPIVGARFKVISNNPFVSFAALMLREQCIQPDCEFNLCQACESSPVPMHPESHPMVKLKQSLSAYDSLLPPTPSASTTPEPPPRRPPVQEEDGGTFPAEDDETLPPAYNENWRSPPASASAPRGRVRR